MLVLEISEWILGGIVKFLFLKLLQKKMLHCLMYRVDRRWSFLLDFLL